MKTSVSRSRFFTQYAAYLFRWQLSTPILWPCVYYLGGSLKVTVLANLIGGLLFFWIDRFIFTSKRLNPIWEVKSDITCPDCGRSVTRGYRLVSDPSLHYDRSGDPTPQYRCEDCSMAKYEKTKLQQRISANSQTAE